MPYQPFSPCCLCRGEGAHTRMQSQAAEKHCQSWYIYTASNQEAKPFKEHWSLWDVTEASSTPLNGVLHNWLNILGYMIDRPSDRVLRVSNISSLQRLLLLYSADIIFTSGEGTESDLKHPASRTHRMSWRQKCLAVWFPQQYALTQSWFGLLSSPINSAGEQ